ncbi:MAG: isoprenyl transferase [Erysipelotrichales bacterium]|nr:isoprenyl transferase [Erysipelotrichales bacterium]
MEHVPSHVAIIMDGNGRWAKKQGKPRTYGHYKGSETIHDIAIAASDAGVKYLTCYAFSTENWIRPKEEVSYLMGLPAVFFERFLKDLMEKNIRVSLIGEMGRLPRDTQKVLQSAIDKTAGNTGMRLIFALNYGSRREIALAVKKIAEEGIPAEEITEDTIASHLMTDGIPDVDLLIRTSGEVRLSNFLLWQLAYAEMIFTDTLWPDFTKEELYDMFERFANRHRRFGGVEK